jgi:hypothetical protein
MTSDAVYRLPEIVTRLQDMNPTKLTAALAFASFGSRQSPLNMYKRSLVGSYARYALAWKSWL